MQFSFKHPYAVHGVMRIFPNILSFFAKIRFQGCRSLFFILNIKYR
jgi:hypothetical protein